MTTEQQKIHNTGIIDGVLNVYDEGLISEEDFWSVLSGLEFEKDEVLNTRLGELLVLEILEDINMYKDA